MLADTGPDAALHVDADVLEAFFVEMGEDEGVGDYAAEREAVGLREVACAGGGPAGLGVVVEDGVGGLLDA